MNKFVCVARAMRHWLTSAGIVLLLAAGAVALGAADNRGALAATVQPIQASFQAPVQAVDAAAVVINFQGRLLDPVSSLPKPDGNYNITFAIFDVDAGGAPLYSETRGVAVKGGVFSINLGDGTTVIDPGLYDGRPFWLSITVAGDPEMSPRIRIAHVPYAIYAINAQKSFGAGDNSVGAAAIVDGSVGTAELAPGAVDNARLADNSVTGNKVADGTLTASDLAQGSGSGINADLLDGKDQSQFAASNHTHGFLPIAFGVINSDGRVIRATSGVTSAWVPVRSQYEIQISGHNYSYLNYVTVVTTVGSPSGCERAAAMASSIGGTHLVVKLTNSAGTSVQCLFQFVTFKM